MAHMKQYAADEGSFAQGGDRQCQVPGQLGLLNSAIDQLAEALQRIGDRLSPVVREQDQKAAVDPPEQGLVQLAVTIRAARQRIENCTERLESLLSRLEL